MKSAITRRSVAFVSLVVGFLVAPAASAYDVERLVDNGDPADHLDLVILGDGYTVDQQDRMTRDANTVVTGLFAAEPFASQRERFNVHLVHLISNESGIDRSDARTDADCATASVKVDTALSCSLCAGGVQRATHCDDYGVLAILPQAVPDSDIGIVLVNTDIWTGSGGLVPAFGFNEYVGPVVRHELAHYLGSLDDEYEECLPGNYDYPPSPNVVTSTDPATLPWLDLVAPETPLPTFQRTGCGQFEPNSCGWTLDERRSYCMDDAGTYADASYWNDWSGAVGLWEGARYHYTGRWRSSARCLMRNLDADLCPVCRRALVQSILHFAGCEPADEVCNGVDDDCDGATDEPPVAVLCGVGACAHEVDRCEAGRPVGCDPMEGALPELCNGEDDDCDGTTDEDVPALICGLGVCARQLPGCVGGAPPVCGPPEGASPEQCNGKDDDCDGETDEPPACPASDDTTQPAPSDTGVPSGDGTDVAPPSRENGGGGCAQSPAPTSPWPLLLFALAAFVTRRRTA